METKVKAANIDEYIAAFPEETQAMLAEMRATIRKAAPKATETISYGMPAFKQNAVLVYFAGYKHHIGFYPTGSGMAAFQDKLTQWKTSKGAVQFPLTEPLPKKLIAEIVRYRIKDDAAKAERPVKRATSKKDVAK